MRYSNEDGPRVKALAFEVLQTEKKMDLWEVRPKNIPLTLAK